MSLWQKLFGPPALDALPDMTGGALNMDYWIIALGCNTDWPRVGDVIVRLESCGMGATVRRDTRHRVAQLRHPYNTSLTCEDGNIFHIANLRRAAKARRVWILQD